jgi:catechol 2,3-dioxygenase-like lactoylglutathione lyase family enzyme
VSIRSIDHVALPLQNTDAMIAFYEALGFTCEQNRVLVTMHLDQQMINFHRPELWQRGFELRAPAATPPCGDLCFVWGGSSAALQATLDGAGAVIEAGPVARPGGRRTEGTSVYTRDPDGNLLEFIQYE